MFWRRKFVMKLYSVSCMKVVLNSAHLRYFRSSTCALFPRTANGRREHSRPEVNLQENFNHDGVNPPPANENFYGIESDVGVIIVNEDTSALSDKRMLSLEQSVNKEWKETYYEASFGVIRRDGDNAVRNHGQYETSENTLFPSKTASSLYKVNTAGIDVIADVFFKRIPRGHSNKENSNISTNSLSGKSAQSFKTITSHCPETEHKQLVNKVDIENEISLKDTNHIESNSLNFIDDFYFDNMKDNQVFDQNSNKSERNNASGFNFVDEFYFGSSEGDNGNQKTTEQSTMLDSSKHNANDMSFIDECFFEDNKTSSFNNDCSYLKGNDKISPEHAITDFPSDLPKPDSNVCHTKQNVQNISSEIDKSDVYRTSHFPSTFKDRSQATDVLKSTIFADNAKSFFKYKKELDVKNDKYNYIESNNIISETKYATDVYFRKDKDDKYKNHAINEDDNDFAFSEQCQTLVAKTSMQSNKKHISKNSIKESNMAVIESNKRSNSQYSEALNEENVANIKHKVKQESVESEASSEKAMNAHDYVMKIRKGKKSNHVMKNGILCSAAEEKLDFKGFRILKNQVPIWSEYTHDEILEVLTNSILYSDDNVVVLNKPYNLIIHDSQTTKGDACLSMLLDDLARELDKKSSNPKLFTIHRLDKETTGCLLLARNEITAQNLKSLFAQRKIIKKYWIVTSKVPDPLKGVIDIPIAEGTIDGKARMVLRPEIPKAMPYKSHCKGGKRAVTHYEVISASGNAALVEVKTETGIKHQIRVHFGFGLECPIIGDHKYSHLTKLAPQKLQADLLQRLHVRQSKVRYIPMHIHAKSILIPEYFDRRNLFIMAPLPEHMRKNLKSLKIKIGKK